MVSKTGEVGSDISSRGASVLHELQCWVAGKLHMLRCRFHERDRLLHGPIVGFRCDAR